MTEALPAFELPSTMTADDLRDRLGDRFPLRAEPPQAMERVYYDTFDWRLFNNGLALLRDGTGEGGTWRLVTRATGEEAAAVAAAPGGDSPAPIFAAELPDGELRATVAPIAAVRALLPLAQVGGAAITLRVLNKDAKTVARVVIETLHLLPDETPLPVVARVVAVRGYGRWRDEVVEALEATPGLRPNPLDAMSAAATAAGHAPGDYSSALGIRLDADSRSDAAARLIHRTLFEAMVHNEPGVRDDIDSEFLHDFRVAIRRTRSALSQIKDALPAEGVEHFRAEFGWLGQMTGPTRDLDVYLLTFDDLRDHLPAHLRERLDPLRDHLTRRQREEQAVLVRVLDTPRCRKLKREWPTFLERPPRSEEEPANAAVPVGVLANRQIWRAFRRTAREAAAITADSPPEQVHELRKTAKKLRYLIEFFGSLYPAAELKELVGELKQVQDVLGEYQDLQVQIDSLERYAAEMQARRDGSAATVPAATLMAIGALTGRLYSRELEVREEMMPVLDRFTRRKLRDRFEALLGSDPAPPVEEGAPPVADGEAPAGAGAA